MRIGVNATCINDRPSGAKQRFLGIFDQLIKRLPEAEFVFFEPRDCQVSSWFGGAANVSARRTPLPSVGRVERFARGLVYWPSALAAERFDIFEVLHLPLVKAPAGKTLLTIHDVRELHPGNGFIKRKLFGHQLGRSLHLADHVVTVSKEMRKEILDFAPQTPVSVIHNGIDVAAFAPVAPAEAAAIRCTLSLPDRFILAVGHFEPRKNYVRLIEAMARLAAKGQGHPLVIVGNDSGERHAVQKRANELGITDRIHILSGLTDAQVRCVYQLCSLFVFPSMYEGFGIPILEAMAAGKPIVVSDIPVFREITGSKGVYFEAEDTDSMARQIERVLGSASEQSRLIEYGKRRVPEFGFGRLANDMAHLYETLLQGSQT